MPRTIPEWLAVIAALVSGAWLYAKPDYEPAIALLTSLLTFVGMRSRSSAVSGQVTQTEPGKSAQSDAKSLLKGAYQVDRLTITDQNIKHISPIPPKDLPSILSLFYMTDRLDALKLLSRKLSAHPNSKETELILATLFATERPDGARALVSQVASNLAVTIAKPKIEAARKKTLLKFGAKKPNHCVERDGCYAAAAHANRYVIVRGGGLRGY